MEFRFNSGAARDPHTSRQAATQAAVPHSATIVAHMGESLGAITHRAYGANTIENQRRILGANNTLNGVIRVPR